MANLLQGNITYDFREAINALIRSTEDAAMIASRWFDICNTETAKDVTLTLSSGETQTVPNLAKIVKALTERSGAINAKSVMVSYYNHGTALYHMGVDVGTTAAYFASGAQRGQHNYKTPYNDFCDACYLGKTASDSFAFFNIPRVVFFNQDSGVDTDGTTHTLTIKAPTARDGFMAQRKGVNDTNLCLTTLFMVVNGDPSRTLTLKIVMGTGAGALTATHTLASCAHKSFLVWAWKGADATNVMEV